MIDAQLLDKYINESGIKKYKLAEMIGITYASLMNKLNEDRKFTLPEVQALVKVLSIPAGDVLRIFFINNVDNNSTPQEQRP